MPYIASLFGDFADTGFSDGEDVQDVPLDDIVQSDAEEFPSNEVINTMEAIESSDDDEEHDTTTQEPTQSPSYVAADGTVWYSSQQSASRQTLRHNILRQRCGPVRRTEMLNIQQTFKCFMSVEMLDIIVRHTNKKAEVHYTEVNTKNPGAEPKIWKPVTLSELYAFLGILIMAGANHSCSEYVRDLWNPKNCPLYRATMGVNRFYSILKFLRFDNANTRSERQRTNKAAPISEIWEMMNANLDAYYKPSENLTIDEQLFPYRGRTSFTQYIPSKPAKYGIKVWWICDAKNSFPLHGQIYTGMQPTGRETRVGERVVKDLAIRYRGSGRNITMDNFFTTLPLAEHLLSWVLTLVGTLRKNKTYIPAAMKAHRTRPPGSTRFAYKENVTMCSYVPKKNKAVILLSSMHHENAIGETGKPEIIQYYNKNKGGVDVMDLFFAEYTTQRQTKRWPLSLYFNMLDVTLLAAYLLYHENNPMIPKTGGRRKNFLRKLAEELCMPLMQERAINNQIMRHSHTKYAIECYIQTSYDAAALDVRPSTSTRIKEFTGTCFLCRLQPKKLSRKTRKQCAKCCKPMCLQHSVTECICTLCANS